MDIVNFGIKKIQISNKDNEVSNNYQNVNYDVTTTIEQNCIRIIETIPQIRTLLNATTNKIGKVFGSFKKSLYICNVNYILIGYAAECGEQARIETTPLKVTLQG